MTQSFRLTYRAYSDLLNIASYTRLHFGEAQRNRYLHAMDKRFHSLAENPLSGTLVSDLFPLVKKS